MSTWHGVKTWSPGDILTAPEMNQFVRDNTEYLFNTGGVQDGGSVRVTISPAGSMNWSSIPQTHEHLIIIGQARTAEGEFAFSSLRLTFGDTSNTLLTGNYRTFHGRLDGTGAITDITAATEQGGIIANVNGATLRGGFFIIIPSYSRSSTHKGAVCFWGDNHGTASGSMRAGVNQVTKMNANSAIGRVRLHAPGAPDIDTGSNATLLLVGRR